MENNKDIKIETDEDRKIDDDIKAGARALGKAIKDLGRDTDSEYAVDETKKKSVTLMIIKAQSMRTSINILFIAIIFIFSSSIVTISSFAQSDSNHSTNQTLKI